MMSPPEIPSDEPLTPAGRLFLQPETSQIINCALGLRHRPDLAAIKAGLKDAVMIRDPRFRSLLVRDRHGIERWRKTEVDLDRHLVVVGGEDKTGSKTSKIIESDLDEFSAAESEAAVNDYVADLAVSTPLSPEKPLWEVHVLMDHRCMVFRIHHALGDGVSLMAMLLADCRRLDDPHAPPSVGWLKTGHGGGMGRRRVWGFLKAVVFTIVFMVEFLGRCFCVHDRKTPISGGAGVELWTRKMSTSRFSLEDMKVVKRAIPTATINDVLFGIVSYGLSKYLKHKSPAIADGTRLTGMAMVNLRKQPESKDLYDLVKRKTSSKLGNKFGAILLPIHYHKDSKPMEHLRRAKVMVDMKKHSLEALFSYNLGDLVMKCLGPKYASLMNYKLVCNTSFSISNVVGPQEKVQTVGNPITYIRVSSSSLAHAITMHMVSYAGKADMQILVAKDIIPDPEFLAECFEEALLEMKQSAIEITKMM